jgi:hydrogenase maturation protease
MKTLLLGMGNPILSDDAVGIRLASDFKAAAHPIPGLDIIEECSVGGLNLLDVLRGYQRVVVLDSLQVQPSQPGAWHHFTADALRETVHLTNVHDANFATALDLGRRLGLPLPTNDQIHILAVEIQDNVTFSEWMSPLLERAYPHLKKAIFQALITLLPETQPTPQAGGYCQRDFLSEPSQVDPRLPGCNTPMDAPGFNSGKQPNHSCYNAL